ncbi:MAG: redox-regulated ATPase YchF [Mollicutes bacterium PWAP]|nr:redox-regulated ATPase YchF [Mollicutes bacterium PWAP]
MALKAGIVGLPNVGKSTLFNAITNSQVEAANYPFATIEPNIGVVELPDKRLDELAKIVKPEKVLHATFEYIDIAGLVEGASKGEGLGNKFLSNIREVDAIVQVVRCFEDENITHFSGKIDPLRDVSIINTELILADYDTINNVLNRVSRKAKNTGDKALISEMNLAIKLKESFENEKPARSLDLNKDENKIAKGWNLLTIKPILYVGNVHEKYVSNPEKSELFQKLQILAEKENQVSIGISVKIEGELAQMDGDDLEMFLDDLNIEESGLFRLTKASFKLLNLETYFTAGVKEVRAWTYKKGYSAPQCAGVIHTDFEKGFIKAEVIDYNDFISLGGEKFAKENGKSRLEGKDYIMKDGDIVHFRFNV